MICTVCRSVAALSGDTRGQQDEYTNALNLSLLAVIMNMTYRRIRYDTYYVNNVSLEIEPEQLGT